jgi:hypothetical protein
MMRKNFFKLVIMIPALVGLSLMSSAPESPAKVADDEVSGIVFEKLEHNFGTISENGGPVTAIFTVLNNTSEAIILVDVKPSCGCTTPDWTKEPIEPGEKGEIKATYSPKGRPGGFDKAITVTTNTKERFTLRIKGTVE